MAEVNGRRFSNDELQRVFAVLDAGGARDAVRSFIRGSQGRGVSNDTIKAIRETHRQLRRSQGFNVKVGGTRRLVDSEGRPRRLVDLPPRQRVAPSRRPLPPAVVPARVQVVYTVLDQRGRPTGVQRVESFDVGEGQPDLRDQVAAARREGEGSPIFPLPASPGGRGYAVLNVRLS